MNKKPNFFRSMRAVLWAFLGIRNKAGLQNDVASLSFVHIIIAGVLGAVLFMAILLLIVNLVVTN
ncbi:DUF2970 domain-containing protein [Polynucleobacter sp. HIN5]|jgi:hypothetical protein|uniref:DUF2970 domain-containing protein n=1 Tax=Polynucleobacter sp. HIN5 TaxID=3047864 RepID=UPI002572ECEE|nr:DUF2970 domain-containing protein [Polynucleobacter sp. HIN5]BEI34366.1 hypothetical protein PHIN5_17340 [Polynucleobacter sp. HIN5]